MKHFQAQKFQTISRRLWTTSIAVLTGACLALLPQWLYAHEITPPPVPSELEVPAGHRPFLLGHATGTQNYMCIPSGSGFVWAFVGPQATLFNDDGRQITTHFLSPNPDEDGMARATWQHSRDTSTVWAKQIALYPMPISWSLRRFPGCCSRWWERTSGLRGDTGSRRPPISNGCIPREVRCPLPAVPRTQTCARGLSCRTPPTTSSTKPPGVSRPGRGARTILVPRTHINRRGSGRGVCRSISVPPLCQCVAPEILRGQPCCGEAWHGCLYLEPPPHLVGCLERQGGIAHENAPTWFG